MRHRKSGVKLNRSSSHRQAMFRNMVTSLLKHDRIKTTDVRAKELRRWADHIITLAKRGDLHSRRQAMAIIREKAVVHKIFEEANDRFGTIQGGYTRIVKIGKRPGDAASISMIEMVSADEKAKKKKKKAAPKKKVEAPKVETQEAEPETSETTDAESAVEAKTETPKETATEDGTGEQAETVKAQAETDSDASPEPEVETASVADTAPEEAAEPTVEEADADKVADKKTE